MPIMPDLPEFDKTNKATYVLGGPVESLCKSEESCGNARRIHSFRATCRLHKFYGPFLFYSVQKN
jgi:hypothetical protein